MENWKDVVEFPDHYEISSHGRLKSKDRETPYITRHGTPSVRHQKGRVLAKKYDGSGYVNYCLTVNGKYHYRKAHTMVLEAFVGPRPSSSHEGDHIDFNQANNFLENLQWLTAAENKSRSLCNRAPRHKFQKTVALESKDGTAWIFNSMEQAARALSINSASISSAAKKGHRCNGFSVSVINEEELP